VTGEGGPSEGQGEKDRWSSSRRVEKGHGENVTKQNDIKSPASNK